MPDYKYQLQSTGGQMTGGVITADSVTDASSRLRDKGYLLSISPLSGGAKTILEKMRGVSVEFGPGLKDVQSFTSQLAVMIKAGIDVRGATENIAEQVDNPNFKKILFELTSPFLS